MSTHAPVKGFVLAINENDGEDADWQDNGIDLVPQESLVVGVTRMMGRRISTRWLCDWEK